MLLHTGYGLIKDGKRKKYNYMFYSLIVILKHL